MKYRIAGWAVLGLLVAGCWMLYFYVTDPGTPLDPLVRSLARYSCPIVLVGDYFNFGVPYYWVFVANAAVYGLAGAIIEKLLQLHRTAQFRTAH